MKDMVEKKPLRGGDDALWTSRCEQILDAAATLFAQRGYADTDTQLLIERLGIGKGTLYRYFPSKRELFLATVDRVMRRLREQIDTRIEVVADPLEKIADAIRTYLTFFAEHPDYVELLIQERAQFKDRPTPTYFQHRAASVEYWRDLYRDLIKAGRIRAMPVERITDVLSDLVYGTMFTNYFAGRSQPVAEQAQDILDVVFHGILSDKAQPDRRSASRLKLDEDVVRNASRGVWLLSLLLAGCSRGPGGPGGLGGPPPKPEVEYCVPKVDEVSDYFDFPGRVEAINAVEVRARVTGYLEKVNFREGETVKQGDLLFEIDARSYEAELAKADGSVIQSEGRLRRLEADFARASSLLAQRSTSAEEFDKVRGDREEALGSVKVAKAQREMARLNVSYCKVTAPLTGKISRRAIDPGNLVKADDTVLTQIVSQTPMYAYFDVDERSAQYALKLIRERKIAWSLDKGLPVYLGLASEQGYPHEGKIDFADVRIDAETGTWRLRSRFDNPDHYLLPGFFVRMRLPIGVPYKALLVSEQALGTDQGQRFLYVVEGDNKIGYRQVTVGKLFRGLRVVNSGIAEGDKIVVTGLQRVRPGVEVVAKELHEMPVVADVNAQQKKK